MTVSRTSLRFRCRTKDCPWPRDEEMHVPWCKGVHECFGGPTHQHHPRKGMGGNNPKSKIVAIICAGIHDQIDNGPLGNALLDLGDGTKLYRIFDYKNNTILEVKYGMVVGIGPDTGESVGVLERDAGNRGRAQGHRESDSPEVAASAGDVPASETMLPALADGEVPAVLTAVAGLSPFLGAGGGMGEVPINAAPDPLPALTAAGDGLPCPSAISPSAPGPSPAVLMDAEGGADKVGEHALSETLPSAFSRTVWLSEGERLLTAGLQLKGLTDEWRFSVGDWVASGEQNLGEEAYGHFSEFEDRFGASYIRALGWVAANTRETRHLAPSWSHARAVARLDVETQSALLTVAAEKGLSSRQVMVLVRPAAPERERHRCPLCQHEHYAVVESEWKA